MNVMESTNFQKLIYFRYNQTLRNGLKARAPDGL